MKNIRFVSFQVKRFRSLMDVTLNISQDLPTIICGENNIGKTNFLRALNLYFNHLSDAVFNPNIKAVNSILKKHSYKSIRKPQIDNRGRKANIGKGILRYAEECSAANNPDKDSFLIDAESRKRQICQKVCQLLESEKWDLNFQFSFLSELV